jgi:hypothetical protein
MRRAKKDDGMTHRYTGPSVLWKGREGIQAGARVVVLGKAKNSGGCVLVRNAQGQQFKVPRAQLVKT